MPKYQDSLRKRADVDEMVRYFSHPAKWWDAWRQDPQGDAVCRRRMWTVGELTIVVLTEVEENEGMSVTNAYERLAAMTLNAYPALQPGRIIWIEHEAPVALHKGENEELDLVRVEGLRRFSPDGWRSDGARVDWRFLWKRTSEPLPELPAPLLALKRWLLTVNVDLLTDRSAVMAAFLATEMENDDLLP